MAMDCQQGCSQNSSCVHGNNVSSIFVDTLLVSNFIHLSPPFSVYLAFCRPVGTSCGKQLHRKVDVNETDAWEKWHGLVFSLLCSNRCWYSKTPGDWEQVFLDIVQMIHPVP